jgi:hypothetical protein
MSSKVLAKVKKEEKVTYNNENLISISFKYENPKDKFTKQEIIKQVTLLRDKHKDKNVTMMVSVDTPFGFRSGKEVKVGNGSYSGKSFKIQAINNNIFPERGDSGVDFDDAQTFVVYLWETPTTRGGEDINNDCLWDCIKKVIGDYKLPKECKSPEELKQLLGIERDEPIDIKYLPRIEEILKININVIGDYYYTSSNKNKMYVNLILNDGHYIINNKKEERSDLLTNIIIRKTNLIVCAEYEDEIKCYDGIKFFRLDWKTYKNLIYNDKENSYINKYDKQIKKETLKAYYDLIMEDNEKLKEITSNRYDISKCGYKIINLSLLMMANYFEKYERPDEIDNMEENWIYNSTQGALIFHTPCEFEIGYDYDQNSCYGSRLNSLHFDFPIKKGVYIELNELPEILSYGIYRVEIFQSGNFEIDKLFRFNDDCYYTHYDLNCARFLGLKMNLIIGYGANAIQYKTQRVKSGNYFNQLIPYLYKFRKECEIAKSTINIMYGSLCEKNTIKKTTINKKVNLENVKIVGLKPIGNDDLHTSYLKDKYYKHSYSYARIGTFLTSKVRFDMAKLVYPYKEHIVRFHTDGFITNVKIREIKIGIDLGEWKCKEIHNVKITNNNEVDYDGKEKKKSRINV